MILVQLARSISLFFTSSVCRQTSHTFDNNDLPLDSILPKRLATRLKHLNLNIENLLNGTEDRLGVHFKMCNLFCQIIEKNADSIKQYDKQDSLQPLQLFTALFRLKYLKDNLMHIIRNGKIIVPPYQPKRKNIQKLEMYDEEDYNEEDFIPFNEEEFIQKTESDDKQMDIQEIVGCIEEFENQLNAISQIKNLTETNLLPIYETMTQLYEDKIDEYISESNLTMKELQAFYKVRTKILHGRITELNKLVGQQHDDIRDARSIYTDELVTLKDEVSDLRNMASQLEIMQQSADFYMHGASLTNQNFDQSTSFERRREATSSLYTKLKSKAVNQNLRASVVSKGSSTQKSYINQRSSITLKGIVKKRQDYHKISNTRKLVRSSTDNTNRLQVTNHESRSNSQLSNIYQVSDPYAIYNQQYGQRTSAPRQNFYSIDQDLSDHNSKLGGQVENSVFNEIFNQSPIHGSMLQSSKGFGQIDEFMRDTALNSQYNSNRRPDTADLDYDGAHNNRMSNDQYPVSEFGLGQKQQFRLGHIATDEQFMTYESTIPSNLNTNRHKAINMNEVFITQEDDLVDLLEQKQGSSEMDLREQYLDGSIDKIEENVNESFDNFDINVNTNDVGESSRGNSEKFVNLKKKLTADRMTPEFKLHNEESRQKYDDDEYFKEFIRRDESSTKKRIVREFIAESDDLEELTIQ